MWIAAPRAAQIDEPLQIYVPSAMTVKAVPYRGIREGERVQIMTMPQADVRERYWAGI